MAIGVSTTQLTKMRADVANLLPDTAVIETFSSTSDGAGGFTEAWASPTGGTVSCRLDPVNNSTSQKDTILAGQDKVIVEYRLTMPNDAPLTADSRVTTNSKTYQIVRLEPDHSWNVSVRAVVTEIRANG